MSIDFATLQGLTIPEGVVTQIADASGRVLWMLSGGKVILEVEKITSDTYAGETTYTGEQFVLLDIYPKTNGTVSVTYGGLTKTITDTSGAAEPNAQQVFFGTFNGVSDSVATPASGELTIEGGYRGFGCGSYSTDSKGTANYCDCVKAIRDFGSANTIPARAFQKCAGFVIQELPEGIETIGDCAFAMTAISTQVVGGSQYNLNWDTAMKGGTLILPSTITSIGSYAFASASGVINSSGGSANKYPCYLAKVKVLATQPPSMGTYSFGDKSTFDNWETHAEIEVPVGCGDIYKVAAGWSEYAYYIVEAS